MTTKVSRASLLAMPEMAHIKEALTLGAQARGNPSDIMRPIRETPLSVFYAKGEHSFQNETPNPNLDQLWFSEYNIRIGDMARGNARIGGVAMKETVSIPNSLNALKIFDEVIEGSEPWSDWKQYSKLVDMTTPKVTVPITKYTDTVGGQTTNQKSIDIYKEAGGTPPPIGGKVTPVELDCSGTKNSFRGTLAVNRNDVKDNNFLAVEQSLKNGGNEFYFMTGKRIIDTLVTDVPTANQETKALLALTPDHAEFEAFIEVIRGKFPGVQRNRADSMYINPLDAAKAVKNGGTNGEYPFISRFQVGPTDSTDVVNNSGLATALGLRNVWETPQKAAGTVLITKRDIAQVVGLREDLTIENFDLSVGGLYESDLVIRFDVKKAHADTGSFLITAF